MTCPCGTSGKNYTRCFKTKFQLHSCDSWIDCETCEDYNQFCVTCPPGRSGLTCKEDTKRVRAKRGVFHLYDEHVYNITRFKNCPILKPPESGQMLCYDYKDARYCKAFCLHGYFKNNKTIRRMMSSDVLRCSQNEWMPRQHFPACISAPVANCPLLDSKDLFIIYDKEQFVNSRAVLYCSDQKKILDGPNTLTCLRNGQWSSDLPKCKATNSCEDLPVPVGGFVIYLPVSSSSSQQRVDNHSAGFMSSRTALHHRAGLLSIFPESLTPDRTQEQETIPTPPGMHGIGERARFACESRYYKLIGSRTRRCQGKGEWSGRPAICMPVCGQSDSPRSPFIVNGNATDVGQWPWQVGLARFYKNDNQWSLTCGAVLLNELWVITAAHCVTHKGTTVTRLPNEFQVYFGKYHKLDNKDDEFVQVRKIKEIHTHPDYDPGLFDADIALMQLDIPVQLNSRVQPICLPTEQTTRKNLVEGKRGVVTGWGIKENQADVETLQQAVLPVVGLEKCEKGYEESGMRFSVTENQFCAGFESGEADACNGDSGGPMVFTDDSPNERKWVLEGIVSWGSPRGCGHPKQYSGLTKVSKFLNWIYMFF